MNFCWNDDEHRREAQDDYRRGGRYGYDRDQYRGHGDCDDAYTHEFDRLRRDEDRRQEERDEERRAEERAYRAQQERAREEAEFSAYYEQEYQAPEPQPEDSGPSES
jgi:hypothetical protein